MLNISFGCLNLRSYVLLFMTIMMMLAMVDGCDIHQSEQASLPPPSPPSLPPSLPPLPNHHPTHQSTGPESHEGILHPSSRHRHRSDSMDSEADFPGLNSPTGPKARRLSGPSSHSGAFVSSRPTSFPMDSSGGSGATGNGGVLSSSGVFVSAAMEAGGVARSGGGGGSLNGEKAREGANNAIPARFKHLAPSWSNLKQLPSFGGSFSGSSSVGGSSVGSRSGSESESDCETPRARKKEGGREEENNHAFQRGDPSVVGGREGVRRPLGTRPSASNRNARALPAKVNPMPGDVDKPVAAPILTSPPDINLAAGDTAPPHAAEEEGAKTTTTLPMERKSLAWGINLESPLSASAAGNNDAAEGGPVFGETAAAGGGLEEEEEDAGQLSPLAYERACAEGGGGGGRQPPGSHSRRCVNSGTISASLFSRNDGRPRNTSALLTGLIFRRWWLAVGELCDLVRPYPPRLEFSFAKTCPLLLSLSHAESIKRQKVCLLPPPHTRTLRP